MRDARGRNKGRRLAGGGGPLRAAFWLYKPLSDTCAKRKRFKSVVARGSRLSTLTSFTDVFAELQRRYPSYERCASVWEVQKLLVSLPGQKLLVSLP